MASHGTKIEIALFARSIRMRHSVFLCRVLKIVKVLKGMIKDDTGPIVACLKGLTGMIIMR